MAIDDHAVLISSFLHVHTPIAPTHTRKPQAKRASEFERSWRRLSECDTPRSSCGTGTHVFIGVARATC